MKIRTKSNEKEEVILLAKPTTMKKEQLAQQFIERLTHWEESQKNQTSGLEYEKSYVEMMKEIEKDVFRQIVESNAGESKKK